MRFELDSEVNALYIYVRGGEVQDGEVVDADEFPRILKRLGGYLSVPIREEDIQNLVA